MPITLDSHAVNLGEQIANLPGSSGVYVLVGKAARSGLSHFHLGWSANLRKRLTRLLGSYGGSDSQLGRVRANLARIECWATGSKLESSLLMYDLAKAHFPDDYPRRLRLRMPWFVGLTGGDPFPRVVVVNRLPRNDGAFFGPFPSRDLAQQYEQELAGLFQLRRCVERLAPEPAHPGCIYGEINQCLRPCQCAVTTEEYASEAIRVAEFLSSNGKSTLNVLSAARDRACEETDFEQAAMIHKRIEKVNAAAVARDEVIADVQQFNGVALTRAVQTRQFRLWPMFGGLWQESSRLISLLTSRAQSRSIRNYGSRSANHSSNVRTEGTRIEELAIFSRWYFSSWRDGQWYGFRSLADLNYRRLVREISKMAQSEPTDTV